VRQSGENSDDRKSAGELTVAESIRMLIVDDHAIVREGQRALINTEPGMEVVGEAEDGSEAVELARSLRPDVILLDLFMPGKEGLEAIEEIKAEDPEARILVLTSYTEDEKVYAAVKAGAMGYLLKDSSPEEILKAIRDVHRGEMSMGPSIAKKLMRELQRTSNQVQTEDPLTGREVQVLQLVARGLPNKAIAAKLVISERTVRTHVTNILGKLHLANRTQAALYALREGLVDLET
jgi:NarL family two-component system response regulator LiaR